MRQRKWLVIPGLIAVGCLVLLGFLVLLPKPRSGFEPDWLLRIKPESESTVVQHVGLPLTRYVWIVDRQWVLNEPHEVITRKLSSSLPFSNGWGSFQLTGSQSKSWDKSDHIKQFSYRITARREGSLTIIRSDSTRVLSRIEEFQHSIRTFFGVQEK